MPPSEYLLRIREKVGHQLLFFPGVSAVIINENDEILLQRSKDFGQWVIPGGIMDPLEEPGDAVIREVFEETGVIVTVERLVGVYSEPDSLVIYPNEDKMMFLSIVFGCRPVGGAPVVNDDESLEVRYFALDVMPTLFPPRLNTYVEQALRYDPHPYFNRSTRKAID